MRLRPRHPAGQENGGMKVATLLSVVAAAVAVVMMLIVTPA